MTYDEIVKHLQQLNEEQLTQLKGHIDHVLLNNTIKQQTYGNAQEFYEQIREGLRSVTGASIPPYTKFMSIKYYKTFVINFKSVDEYVDSCFPDLSKIERIKLDRLFVKLVIEKLKDLNHDIKLVTICINLSQIPSLIEDSFPGYIESGLGHLIIDKY